MSWKERLQNASFRGVVFKVEAETSDVGRRTETHEYPNRDKPYSEDLGKTTFRTNITAYVIGDDCYTQRDLLIDALNKPGPGALIHPSLGEINVCVDGEIKVSTSSKEGRMVRFDLKFVEAGELSYPTAGAATAQNLISSCTLLDDCINNSFARFGLGGLPDFVQNGVINSTMDMIGFIQDGLSIADSAISDAARLLQGDISVLLPPPSSGKTFIERLQTMWRTGNRLYGNTGDLLTMIKTLSGVSLGNDLAPRGVWKTDSVSTKSQTEQRNYVASAIRTTAIAEAVFTTSNLPAPLTQHAAPSSSSTGVTAGVTETTWPTVSHPALVSVPPMTGGNSSSQASQVEKTESVVTSTGATETDALPTWEELTEVRDTLNAAIDKELARTDDDQLFIALRRVKAALNIDIKHRLSVIARTVERTPAETAPAIVLAARWYDNATRAQEIIQRNGIAHPGFVPAKTLRVPAI